MHPGGDEDDAGVAAAISHAAQGRVARFEQGRKGLVAPGRQLDLAAGLEGDRLRIGAEGLSHPLRIDGPVVTGIDGKQLQFEPDARERAPGLEQAADGPAQARSHRVPFGVFLW
jgi:hypothetical protein